MNRVVFDTLGGAEGMALFFFSFPFPFLSPICLPVHKTIEFLFDIMSLQNRCLTVTLCRVFDCEVDAYKGKRGRAVHERRSLGPDLLGACKYSRPDDQWVPYLNSFRITAAMM